METNGNQRSGQKEMELVFCRGLSPSSQMCVESAPVVGLGDSWKGHGN